MAKLVMKSLAFGFLIGTVFLAVAPFGLMIAFVEFLRPILIPGIDLFQPLWQHAGGVLPFPAWIYGLILNGLIYSMLCLVFLLTQKYVASKTVKCFLALFVVLLFFTVTGMLANLYWFLISPKKSFIFRIGA